MYQFSSRSKFLAVLCFALLAVSLSAVADDDDHRGTPRPAKCSNKSLKDTYAFYQYGEVLTQGPAADVGVLIADEKVSFSGSEVVHTPNGEVVQITFCNGTYEVKESCMGNLRWDAEVGGLPCGQGFSIGERTAAVAIAKEDVYILSTTPGAVLVGIATKK
jgi:hypothetical protein